MVDDVGPTVGQSGNEKKLHRGAEEATTPGGRSEAGGQAGGHATRLAQGFTDGQVAVIGHDRQQDTFSAS